MPGTTACGPGSWGWASFPTTWNEEQGRWDNKKRSSCTDTSRDGECVLTGSCIPPVHCSSISWALIAFLLTIPLQHLCIFILHPHGLIKLNQGDVCSNQSKKRAYISHKILKMGNYLGEKKYPRWEKQNKNHQTELAIVIPKSFKRHLSALRIEKESCLVGQLCRTETERT